MPGFNRLLIANRGEIACRVARTARRLGLESIAVYSDADANARHVAACDAAVGIGGLTPAESYLRIEAIIEAARRSGAQAIHPGYGFLAENAAFAEACQREGLIFVGPPASAIRAMGSKSAAKTLMERAGVPLTPGYHGANQDARALQEAALCAEIVLDVHDQQCAMRRTHLLLHGAQYHGAGATAPQDLQVRNSSEPKKLS